MRSVEFAGDQRGIREESSAESEINSVLDQIEFVIREAQLDLGFRIGREKIEYDARQEISAKTHRSRDADRARRHGACLRQL
jgi:hypothetical protein